MISIIRRLINSRYGAVVGILFLGLVALLMVAGDLSGNQGASSFSFFGNSGTVAKVGGSSLSDTELQSRIQRAFVQARRDNPGLTMDAFIADGGVDQISRQLIMGLSVREFARQQGVHVSKRMIDAQIAAIPAFQDATGKFSQAAFRQILGRQDISEPALRNDIENDLLMRQMVVPTTLGVRLSNDAVLPYASMLLEARAGRIAAIPAGAFPLSAAPNDAQLKGFYARNSARFTIPEQRHLRYAVIDAARFTAAAIPSAPEIAQYYASHKDDYAARETRSIEQLILPTQAAAAKAVADAKAGQSLASIAQKAGLSVNSIEAKSPSELAAHSSDAVAKLAFATAPSTLAGPVRATLGWSVLRVTAVQKIAEKPLAQVSATIADTLAVQKKAQLLSNFTAKLEDQIADGATFDEVAKDNGLQIVSTPALLSNGQNAGDPAYRPDADVAPLIKAGFSMEADDDAQIVPIVQQQRYALLHVGAILPAAAPPLDKVRTVITQLYALHEGAAKARTLAEKIRDQVAKGMPLEKAMSGTGVPLPPIQRVGGRRADLIRGDQRPPAQIAILFAMAQGSVKVLPIGDDRGWFIVQLDAIQQGDAAKVPGLVNNMRKQIGTVVSGEYGEQFEKAIERELIVKRRPEVVARVTKELRRANGGAAQ